MRISDLVFGIPTDDSLSPCSMDPGFQCPSENCLFGVEAQVVVIAAGALLVVGALGAVFIASVLRSRTPRPTSFAMKPVTASFPGEPFSDPGSVGPPPSGV